MEFQDASKSVAPLGVTLFISHATEDKPDFVRPLAAALLDAGFSLWLDEVSITMGDSLRQKIDEGLSKADYGVVILSPDFIRKTWTNAELDALFSRESSGRKMILPIWKDVDENEVRSFSPLLAGRWAPKASLGIPGLVKEIQRAVCVEQGNSASAVGEDVSRKNFTDETWLFMVTYHAKEAEYFTVVMNATGVKLGLPKGNLIVPFKHVDEDLPGLIGRGLVLKNSSGGYTLTRRGLAAAESLYEEMEEDEKQGMAAWMAKITEIQARAPEAWAY